MQHHLYTPCGPRHVSLCHLSNAFLHTRLRACKFRSSQSLPRCSSGIFCLRCFVRWCGWKLCGSKTYNARIVAEGHVIGCRRKHFSDPILPESSLSFVLCLRMDGVFSGTTSMRSSVLCQCVIRFWRNDCVYVQALQRCDPARIMPALLHTHRRGSPESAQRI